MNAEPSFWIFVTNASPVVKVVLLILLLASIISWTIIFQRHFLFRYVKSKAKKFEKVFWSGVELNQLHHELSEKAGSLTGLANIFYRGFNEYKRLSKQPHITSAAILEGVQRSMRIAQTQELENLESHLSFLANVGSTSPFIGIFGTVWGIMTAFRALGTVQQASIAMVAPGISEALIATAIGLFAAIPAVLAYNRFNSQLTRLATDYDIFQDEMLSILQRQIPPPAHPAISPTLTLEK